MWIINTDSKTTFVTVNHKDKNGKTLEIKFKNNFCYC